MPRLTAPPPLVAKLKPTITQSPADERERSRYRDRTEHWRKWEKTAPWERLRRRVFARDMYICQRTGVSCTGKHPAPNSPVAHHVRKHDGNASLFWDERNIITVCKAVHDSEIQAEERRAAQARGAYASAVQRADRGCK